MNTFKKNIYKLSLDEEIPAVECFTYNLISDASTIQSYSYQKCDGTVVNSGIGGSSSHNKTFCALEGSITTISSEITITKQDLCPTGFAIPISSQAGSVSLTDACGYIDRLLIAYCELPTPFTGSILYRDIELSIPFGEGSSTRFHAITTGAGNRSVELSITGVILSTMTC